jgi:DNA-binding MarR family transcriptional regulator
VLAQAEVMELRHPVDEMSWEDLGFLFEGMSFASRPLGEVTTRITGRYSLGPRGVWILQLISSGQRYPLDIARVFGVGRSLVTAELTRLHDAGLIRMRQSEGDRRKTELSLTREGEQTRELIRRELTSLAHERLGDFSQEEILLCARLLRSFRTGAPA